MRRSPNPDPRGMGNADSVVGNGKRQLMLRLDQAHGDLAGFSVTDGIAQRFLGDAVQVQRGGGIDADPGGQFAFAANAGEPGDALGQLPDRGGQPLIIHVEGAQSPGQFPRMANGFVNEIGDLLGVGGGSGRGGDRIDLGQSLRQGDAEHGGAGKFLAQPVVEIVADANALAFADVEDLTLEAAAFGEVADRHRLAAAIAGIGFQMRQKDASPEARSVFSDDPIVVLVPIGRLRIRKARRIGGGVAAIGIGPDARQRPADNLGVAISEQAFGAVVPPGDIARMVEHEKRLVAEAVDQQAELFPAAEQLSGAISHAGLELVARGSERFLRLMPSAL
jgi:hypothetical protein